MIESRFWRQELRKDIRWLRVHRRYKRWSEKQLVLYERRLMLVAFQVRSLLERPKVRWSVANAAFECTAHTRRDTPPPNRVTLGQLWFHFDLEQPNPVSLTPLQVCNQLIHHYVMFTASQGTSFSKVSVFSDYKRDTCLYVMDVTALIELFATFAEDSSALTDAKIEWNAKRLDYDFVETPES